VITFISFICRRFGTKPGGNFCKNHEQQKEQQLKYFIAEALVGAQSKRLAELGGRS